MKPIAIASLAILVLAAGCSRVQTVGMSREATECYRIAQHLTEQDETGAIELVDADSVTRRSGARPVEVATVEYRQGPARRLISCTYVPGTRELIGIRYRSEDLSQERVGEVLRAVR